LVHLHVLGDCTIRTPNGLFVPRGKKLFGIALFLILERGTPIARERLMRLFWPNEPDAHTRHALREIFRKLRRKGLVITGDEHVVRVPRHCATTDIELASTEDPSELATHPLTILPGYTPTLSAAHSDWLDDTRTRLRNDMLRTLSDALERAHAIGDVPTMTILSERIHELDPLNATAKHTVHASRLTHTTPPPLGNTASAAETPARYTPRYSARHTTISSIRETPHSRTTIRTTTHPAEHDTPLLGRTDDLHIIASAIDRTIRGRGGALTITGPVGIGKSRVLREARTVARDRDVIIAHASCTPPSFGIANNPWRDLIRRLRKSPGANGCHPATNDILTTLLLQHDCGITDETEEHTAERDDWDRRVHDAITDLVDAIAYEQPLLISIDDIQWASPNTRAILNAVTTQAHQHATLCLTTTTHPDSASPSPDSATRHTLTPLTQSASLRHLELYRRDTMHRMPNDIRDLYIHTAAGNPLYAEELVNHWASTRNAIPTFHSMQQLIDTRLHTLDVLPRRLLQASALLDTNATTNNLAYTAGVSHSRTLHLVNELRQHGFITVTGVSRTAPHALRLQCRHPFIAERAVAMLPATDRRTLETTITRMNDELDHYTPRQ
jgi:hypothetical protein